jgi:hypothetical protein
MDGEEAVMENTISERQLRRAINFMAEAVLKKLNKRVLARRFREAAGDKQFCPGDTLKVSYTVDVTHQFPEKKGRK